jgi:hypothetical protein
LRRGDEDVDTKRGQKRTFDGLSITAARLKGEESKQGHAMGFGDSDLNK